jgi:hypothetical protein
MEAGSETAPAWSCCAAKVPIQLIGVISLQFFREIEAHSLKCSRCHAQRWICKCDYDFGRHASQHAAPTTPDEVVSHLSEIVRATNKRSFMQGASLGLADGYSPDLVGPKLSMPTLMISGPVERNARVLTRVAPAQMRLELLTSVGHLR